MALETLTDQLVVLLGHGQRHREALLLPFVLLGGPELLEVQLYLLLVENVWLGISLALLLLLRSIIGLLEVVELLQNHLVSESLDLLLYRLVDSLACVGTIH